jgi:Tol biopolymer transport system component
MAPTTAIRRASHAAHPNETSIMSAYIRPIRPLLAASATLVAACADVAPTAPAADLALAPAATVSTDLLPIDPCTRCGPGPDKGKVLFTRYVIQGHAKQFDLFKSNPDGTGVERLTTSAEAEFEPAWSANYRRVAFVRMIGGQTDLFVMNADGTGVQRLTDTPTVSESAPAWSPDDKRIVHEQGDGSLAITAADGSGTVPFPAADGCAVVDPYGSGCVQTMSKAKGSPTWSPDGTEIVFTINAGFIALHPSGVRAAKVADPSSVRWVVQGPLGFKSPRYSPSGTELAYLYDGKPRIVRVSDGVQLQQFTPGFLISGLSWAPDGKQLVTKREDNLSGVYRLDRASGLTFKMALPNGATQPAWSR